MRSGQGSFARRCGGSARGSRPLRGIPRPLVDYHDVSAQITNDMRDQFRRVLDIEPHRRPGPRVQPVRPADAHRSAAPVPAEGVRRLCLEGAGRGRGTRDRPARDEFLRPGRHREHQAPRCPAERRVHHVTAPVLDIPRSGDAPRGNPGLASGELHFAYVDESGDAGPRGSRTYSLGCVFVDAQAWPATFDSLIGFRRFLRATYGVPVRAEVKANYLLHNGGPFRPLQLSEAARFSIYRGFMRLQPKLGIVTLAVVVDKAAAAQRYPGRDPRDIAWEWLLQRIERFMTQSHRSPVLVVHDEGEAILVRKLARKARRAGTAGSMFGTGVLRRQARDLLDDPVPKDSRQSYFLQLADLVAYAGFRRLYPPPPRPVQVVPQTMWDELATAPYWQANMYSGGPPGIVHGP